MSELTGKPFYLAEMQECLKKIKAFRLGLTIKEIDKFKYIHHLKINLQLYRVAKWFWETEPEEEAAGADG